MICEICGVTLPEDEETEVWGICNACMRKAKPVHHSAMRWAGIKKWLLVWWYG
jgi:hypothetical protein